MYNFQLRPVNLGSNLDFSVASSEPGSDPALPVDGMVRSLLLGLLHQRVSEKTFLGLLNFFLKYLNNTCIQNLSVLANHPG